MSRHQSGSASHPANEGSTTRLEAFSDGVFAIAITLLVLEIRLPEAGIEATAGSAAALLARCGRRMPGTSISFVTIGIMWANHHEVIRLIARVDHGLMVCNLLLLMAISFTPFPTAVMAEHLPHPGWDRNVAVAFYCGSFTADGALLQPAVAPRRARPPPDSRARERRPRARHHARLLAGHVPLRPGDGRGVRQRAGGARHRRRPGALLHPAAPRRPRLT